MIKNILIILMKENNILQLIQENDNIIQDNIKNQLNKKIFKPIECYLMDKNWKNIFLNYNNNKDSQIDLNLSTSPEINDCFIDNYSLVLNTLQNGSTFCFAGRKTIETLFTNESINTIHNISKIYVAEKKIIIDIQEDNYDNKSLLIINPFEQIFNKQKILILVFNNNYEDKEEIFKSLLSENNDNLSDISKIKEKYKNYSIDFEEFYYNNLVFEKQIDSQKEQLDKNRKNILQILILLYYYEEYLSKKKFCF